MPKPSRHVLIWSHKQEHYELQAQGQPVQCFRPGDEPTFSRWLDKHTSFAFVGQAGRLSLLKEARPRGTSYWYAYHKQGRHTRKRYLGRTDQVTFVRLEQEAKALTSQPEPASFVPEPGAPSSELKGMLLSSKLSAPRLPIFLVERSRLLTDLDAVGSHPLTLVSASAGSGKTTLLSTWAASKKPPENGRRAQGTEQAVAWLSLEKLDDDLIRFWDLVIAALRRCHPTLGETALALLHSPQFLPLSTCLSALLQEFERNSQDLILILDDYHVLSHQAIFDSMRFLLDHAPATLHLVLISRTDPDLPLSRFRVRGQLLEIRDRDLRFTQKEADSFLRDAMGLPLSEDEVATLSQRTEGWIAGLHLAALSLRKRPDHAAFVKNFAGTHRYLLDYVQQDILARLSLPLQNFLLQTAVLPRMNAALCQAVTAGAGEPESQEILEALERDNLFVVPLDEHRLWYRYHDLFREALLARLHASHPQLVPLLHLRAASFYEAQREWREAITHALAAGDSPYAASLLERAAPAFWLSGEAEAMLTWLTALPDTVFSTHARLALNTALHLLEALYMTIQASYVRPLAQVEQTMARVEAVLHSQEESITRPLADEALPAAEVTVLQRRLRLLRALIAARAILLRGEDAEGLRHLVEEIEGLDEQEEVSWKMISLSLTFWLTEVLQQEGALLIERLLEARRQVLEAADHRASVRVMIWLALAYLRAGRWRQVEQACREGLAQVEQIGEQTAMIGYLHFFLAYTSYVWNRLEEASSSLQQQLRIAQDWQQADLLIMGEMLLALVELARSNLEAADQALHKAEELIQQERFAAHTFWMTTARVQYWLAIGDLDQASNWAERVAFSLQTWNPDHKLAFLMQVRVSLARAAYPQAIEALECFSAQLDRPGDIQMTIQFLALQVVALHYGGKQEQAQTVAARLLTLTEPEGNIRVFLDLGEPMKRVLLTLLAAPNAQLEQAHRSLAPSRSFVAQLLAVFEQEEQHGRTSPRRKTPLSQALALPQKSASASPTPLEPLTRREQEVLRWLSEGASNQQIATALVIQLSTVKKHVSSLLAKLGADSRTQAIAQARTFSLL